MSEEASHCFYDKKRVKELEYTQISHLRSNPLHDQPLSMGLNTHFEFALENGKWAFILMSFDSD